jgi:peptide/nickel transport system permease protein
VLRNALIPVITVIGLQFASVIGGAIIVESIFNLPGMGQLLLNGVLRRDFPVVQAAVVVAGLGVLLTNVLVDLSYGMIDPRLTYD